LTIRQVAANEEERSVNRVMRAPAKVNLALLVGPRLPNGYHALFTVFAPISLYDRLEFELEAAFPGGVPGSLRLSCPGLEGDSNLVMRALRVLEGATGRSFSGTVDIAKNIPVAAGLGGGSSDAAAALLAGAAALAESDILVELPVLHRLAAGIGADVPFFLGSGPALATGIGERLESIDLPALPIVLVLPTSPLSTAAAYRALDELRSPESAEAFERRAAVRRGAWLDLACTLSTGGPLRRFPATAAETRVSAARTESGFGRRPASEVDSGCRLAAPAVAAMLENELEPASFALQPELAQVKQQVVDAGALGALMSGSGPTVFGICGSTTEAQAVCERLRAQGHDCLAVTSNAV
jgi:4-diphosphocytidyl-2-C-methyl-D-erythritol kinase